MAGHSSQKTGFILQKGYHQNTPYQKYKKDTNATKGVCGKRVFL
jgi:hypothetical protein